MNTKIISIAIIIFISSMLIIFGLNWWKQSQESAERDENAKLRGENIQLKKQDSTYQILFKHQKYSIDSSKLISARIIHDTVLIYDKNKKESAAVSSLDTSGIFRYVSDRLNSGH